MRKLYPYIFVILALITVGNWLTVVWWAPNLTIIFVEFCLCFIVLIYPILKYKHFLSFCSVRSFKLFNIYSLYTLILSILSIIRYSYQGERSDFAHLMFYNMAMLTCFCVYTFSYPDWFSKACKKMYKLLPVIAIIYMPFAKNGAIGDLMGFLCMPAILSLLLFDGLSTKRKLMWLSLTLLIIFTSYWGDARSHVIKYTIALLFGLTVSWDKFYYKIRHVVWLFIIAPFVLFFLGVTNAFNVFEMNKYINNKSLGEGTIADTRTIVYTEVLYSAVQNKYIVWGRGIGKGYESLFQERWTSEDNSVTTIQSMERQSEVGIHNIFTWGGIVYFVVYTLMWCSVLFCGVYKSRNRYVRAVGFYLAFYYLYSWVENFQSFSIVFISSWFMVALCLSPYFRRMDDEEFKFYFTKLLK